MSTFIASIVLPLMQVLAEGAAAPASKPDEPTGIAKLFANPMVLVVLAMFVFMFVLKNPKRAEEKKRAAMLKEMKKGDRVQTIGGILGTIVDVRDNEVVVKIDETTNTKMRFVREAIRAVVVPDKDKTESK